MFIKRVILYFFTLSSIEVDTLKEIILNICDDLIKENKPFFIITELENRIKEKIGKVKRKKITEIIGVLKSENKINSYQFPSRELYYSKKWLICIKLL